MGVSNAPCLEVGLQLIHERRRPAEIEVRVFWRTHCLHRGDRQSPALVVLRPQLIAFRWPAVEHQAPTLWQPCGEGAGLIPECLVSAIARSMRPPDRTPAGCARKASEHGKYGRDADAGAEQNH